MIKETPCMYDHTIIKRDWTEDKVNFVELVKSPNFINSEEPTEEFSISDVDKEIAELLQ